MSDAVERILSRLQAFDFVVRAGEFAPFGERIPLIVGAAWDPRTAQLALVAEEEHETTDDEWRQLLFARAGLRHHLAVEGPSALGTPVILAVVDDGGSRRLRAIAEDLAQRYVIFNRVDLNLVLHEDLTDPDRFDDALAPLLPRCREALGEEISTGEIRRFWKALEGEVMLAASGLDPIFTPFREEAGRRAVAALVGDSERAPDLPSPWPVGRLRFRNFRSIEEADVSLAPVTIVHGPNGGGKSTLLEGLELVWAGTSQRKPANVAAAEYARHLPRNGVGDFEVRGDNDAPITGIAESGLAELSRCVLTHEAVAALVSQSPEDRYAALVATTGLEVPDLAARTATLVDEAKRTADDALRRSGLSSLPRRDSHGERHLRTELHSSFSGRLPARHELLGAEEALSLASSGAYAARRWPTDQHAVVALVEADQVISRMLGATPELEMVAPALDDAVEKVGSLLEPMLAVAQAVRALLVALERPRAGADADLVTVESEQPLASASAPVPPDLAARWLAHGSALKDAAERFRADAKTLRDVDWSDRLEGYADALFKASESVPTSDLVPLAKAVQTPGTRVRRADPIADRGLFLAAGFVGEPAEAESLIATLREFLNALQRHIDVLDKLIVELKRHPAREFASHSDRVLDAICRFELARALRREGPILRASERLVADLLKGRLAPVIRELVASIVRFEWYFKPLLIPDAGRKIVLGGLATSDESLDARLVLNSAERTALGIAWFLALHLLQPASRRRVLAMDDPVSVFDSANQAGFTSTLRAFVRLTRPEQVLVAVHDDAAATLLAEEFAPVDGWPEAVSRLRCQRDLMDLSVISTEWVGEASRSMAEEAGRLQLGDEEKSTVERI